MLEYTEVIEWGELEEVLQATKSCIASSSPFTSAFPAYDKSRVARDDFEQNPAVKYYIYSDNGLQGYIRIFKQLEDSAEVGFVDHVCPFSSDPRALLQALLDQTGMQRLYINSRPYLHLLLPFESKTLHLEHLP